MTAKTCPRCGTVYHGEDRFCPRDGAALRASSTVDLAPGSILHERYEIRHRLGSGGMGVVYLANDVRLERLCALKVLRSGAFADPEASARFYREATNASRISHPHVVAVFDFDETEDGLTYLATEYVEGRSLARMLDDLGVLSPRPAARIVWQVANALDAAHRLRIVHRDVKPGNIMLTRYGEWDDFVKVVDFGIAKAFGGTTGSTITTRGRWVGTPAYMSPEQWVGGEVDHRSDIYSLGLIAVRMLAGGLPPEPPTRPGSGTDPGVLDALPSNDWPEAVRNVLERALALRPADRYPAATDFSAAFVEAVTAWIPPEPGVREPWEARIDLPAGADTSAASPASLETPRSVSGGSDSPPSSRPRRLVLVAAAVVAVGGAAYLGARALRGSGPAASSPADTPEGPPSAAAAGTVPGVPGVSDSAADRGTDPVRPDSESGDRTEPPAAPGTPEPSPQADPTASVEASLERLRTLTDPSAPDPDSIRYAVTFARRLLDGALPEDARLEVVYHLAEANLYLGNDPEACRDLRAILPAAERSGVFARGVRLLLDRSCEPGGDPPDLPGPSPLP